MLNLFQSIFGRDTGQTASYPETLITRAIARALAATDPRLGLISGYRRTLRPAVIHAIDHVVQLVDSLGPAVELTRSKYGTDARLAAVFASVDHMRDILVQDDALTAFRRQAGASPAERAYALLMMEKHERKVLGVDLRGDIVQREVAQVSVNFTAHRLVDPATEGPETRRLLIRRAFDHLLTLALARITRERELRETLKRQHALLKRKLALLKVGNWGFDAGGRERASDTADIEMRLAEIQTQLQSLPPDEALLKNHLAILAEVLDTADTQLWKVRVPLIVDRMGSARRHATATDLAFELDELHSTDGRTLYILPVCILLRELPAPADPFSEARRYLS